MIDVRELRCRIAAELANSGPRERIFLSEQKERLMRRMGWWGSALSLVAVLVSCGWAQVETQEKAVDQEAAAEEARKAAAAAEAAAQEDLAVQALDSFAQFQHQSVKANQSPIAHWGWDKDNYTQWGTHSNRLIPVYTFGTLGAGTGLDLDSYTGPASVYRDSKWLQRTYKRDDPKTVNPDAVYMDQTQIFSIQQAALEAGKKNIILFVFDGMDWQTTWAAAIAKTGQVPYRSGRGTGLHIQDYQADGTTQFGYMVTSPFCDEAEFNVNTQQVTGQKADTLLGGYDIAQAGDTPWASATEFQYLVGTGAGDNDAYTDSASSATSMMAGIKTYNNAIGVDMQGRQVLSIAHVAQKLGYKVGVVSSVPISHATPASAYAHNVTRNDYQDLTRDLLGLPSISHPKPLPGMDVVIGGGYGTERDSDSGQGDNFVPGNSYLTAEDIQTLETQGHYLVSRRQPGVDGSVQLQKTAEKAAKSGQRLLGFYGADDNKGHLPFATADGDYRPVQGRSKTRETYSEADLKENPTLEEMTAAALKVLENNDQGFWLMVEAGDVDWANHDDNLDNSIGAVHSGDRAVKVITDWVEANSNWEETILIVTADHGHYLVIEDPEALSDLSNE